MNPMQSPENQMPGQPPSSAPPGTMLSSINFAAFTTQQNRPYLIAAVGGVVAFLSFFILPFWGYSYKGSSVLAATSGSVTASGATDGSGLLWLSCLGALVALVVAALLALNIRVIAQLTPALGARIILGSGIVALVCQLIAVLQINGSTSLSPGESALLSSAGFSYGYSIGFWIMLLAFIAVIVGGVMNLRQTQAAAMPGAAM